MYNSANSTSLAPENINPQTRAIALEREITDLCAQIKVTNYCLLQLIAKPDD